MNSFQQKKLIEVVLYVLNKVGGIDFYHLFKILYFADREHIAKWGFRIINDDFKSLQYGPVPDCLYDAVKGYPGKSEDFLYLFQKSVEFAGEEAPNVLFPKRPANQDYISESEINILKKSIHENANLSFNALKIKSHDFAWKKAQESPNLLLSTIDMAIADNASPAILELLEEEIELESLLS